MRDMREDWLTRQLETLEEQLKKEQQRLHEAKKRQAMLALISLSLPGLIGERSDQQGHTTAIRLLH
jgi:hypothetical protein